MKKEKRQVYVELTKLRLPPLNEPIAWTNVAWASGFTCLCLFCKYALWRGADCESFYPECRHPLNVKERTFYFEEAPGWIPGQDCWGFQSAYPLEVVADYIGQRLEGKKVALPTNEA